MAWSPVVLHLISFFCCVYGAYLRYGSAGLSDSPLNVALTVGARERVYCIQVTGPVPTSIEWYNPQGLLVSRDGSDEVNQVSAIGGRASILNYQSYQRSQGGQYECKVDLPGNNTEKLLAFIATGSATTTIATLPPTEAPSKTSSSPAQPAEPPTTSEPTTTSLPITTSPPPTQPPPPSKVVGVRVTPSVQGTSPTLTVTWQALPSGALTYTVRYSTQPGEVNTPPEGALEVTGISGTSTVLTALERGTTYYIWVVGVSEGGEGIRSDRTSGVTHDTPGPVLDLSYEEDTDTSVNITWKPPKEPNGDIVAYFVELGVYNKESTIEVRIDVSRSRYTLIRALEPGVPYTVTVRSSTAVGKGEPMSIAVFTVQQAPTARVGNVKFERISNNRAALVSWTPLTLHQARGFPVYFVANHPSGQAAGAESTVTNTTESKVVIDDLDPTTEYTFTVDVGTAGGKSTLDAVEAERVNPGPVCSDSISATGVGLFLGGLAAGVIGVVLIVGIVGGACWLRRSKHKSSPRGKAAGEEVPMEDNPAYGEVNIYDTVKEPNAKEN